MPVSASKISLFVKCFCSLHPSQQFFSHAGMGLPGLNQYLSENKVSCTPDKDIREFNPGIENLILPMLSYPGSQVTPSC